MTNDELIREVAKRVSEISSLLGIPVTESNENTPNRVAKMYCNELFANRDKTDEDARGLVTLFTAPQNPGPVIVRNIPFHSTCEHHWLPFFGTCDVIYVPTSNIIGLSKIPRIVDFYSRKPQLQERLTNEIGDFLNEILCPSYIKVKMTAKHTCVMCRGVESDCETVTIYERGYQ